MDQLTLQNEIVEYIEQDCLNEAYDLLINEYISYFYKDAFFYLSLTDIFLALKDYDSVIFYLNEWNKTLDLSNERYGDAFFGLGDFDKALEFYLKCPHQDLDDSSFRILFMIASSLYNLGKYTESISYYEDFLLDNKDFDAYFFCANAYSFTNQFSEAERYYNNAFYIANDQQKIEMINYLFQNSILDIKNYIKFLENSVLKNIYTVAYLLKAYQFSEAYSIITKMDTSLTKHFLLGYYYMFLGDKNNSQFELNSVLSSNINNKQDIELLKFTLESYFNEYNHAIELLFDVSKESSSTYYFIIQYLHRYKKYKECLTFYNHYTCIDLSNTYEINEIIMDCMFQIQEYGNLIDFISFEMVKPKTLNTSIMEIKAYLALDEVSIAKSLSQSIMLNGYVAIEWYHYLKNKNEIDAINQLISFMKSYGDQGVYIPGINEFFKTLE